MHLPRHVSVGNQHATCQDVNTVIVFVNSMIGCDLLSRNMVYNYFSRPHLANKRLFGTRALVQISRDVNDRDATIQPQCEGGECRCCSSTPAFLLVCLRLRPDIQGILPDVRSVAVQQAEENGDTGGRSCHRPRAHHLLRFLRSAHKSLAHAVVTIHQ